MSAPFLKRTVTEPPFAEYECVPAGGAVVDVEVDDSGGPDRGPRDVAGGTTAGGTVVPVALSPRRAGVVAVVTDAFVVDVEACFRESGGDELVDGAATLTCLPGD